MSRSIAKHLWEWNMFVTKVVEKKEKRMCPQHTLPIIIRTSEVIKNEWKCQNLYAMRVFSEVSTLASIFHFFYSTSLVCYLNSNTLFRLFPLAFSSISFHSPQKWHHAMIARTRSFDIAISRCCRTKRLRYDDCHIENNGFLYLQTHIQYSAECGASVSITRCGAPEGSPYSM